MENGRKLLRWIALAAIAVIGLCGLASLFGSSSQAEEIRRPDVIHIDAVSRLKKQLEMPPAIFLHDKHTAALEKEGKDCSVCHTPTADGHTVFFKRDKDGKSAQKLEDLYHKGCIGCHAKMADADKDTGPLDGQCRLCHDTATTFAGNQAKVPMGDKSLHYLHVSSKAITSPGNDENCGVCHHVFDEKLKKLVWEKGKEDACSACHGEKAVGNTPSLKDAVHAKCVWCHVNVGDEARATIGASTDKGALKGKKGKKARDDAKAQAAAIEASIVTGPDTCAGCHTVAAQEKYKKISDVPRLMRGQPDATVLLPVGDGTVKRDVNSPDSGMNPVIFNHKAHEAVTDSCRTCHHVRISSCTECHTVEGKKEGNFITLAEAMHDKQADQSCVGCHQKRIMQQRDCAGCHASIPAMTEQSCNVCHTPITGISLNAIADGSAFTLSKEKRAQIAAENLAAKPAPATPLAPQDIPETVTIGTLSNEFQPSTMPHRKIYDALQKGAAKDGLSALAGAFHSSPVTTCAACHHNSPLETIQTPPKCAGCHGAQADKQNVDSGKPSLKAAYHQQCIACHALMQIKPAATDCAGCHAPLKK